MSKKKKNKKVDTTRNPYVVSARSRSVRMHDRRQKRGGARCVQVEYLEENF